MPCYPRYQATGLGGEETPLWHPMLQTHGSVRQCGDFPESMGSGSEGQSSGNAGGGDCYQAGG